MEEKRLVHFFGELKTEQKCFAGGKGRILAHLYQKGYPVPNGFIIMPTAFENDELNPEAWVQKCIPRANAQGWR